MTDKVTVDGCPCGGQHRLGAEIYAEYQRVVKDKPPTLRIQAGGDCWLVPRLYIALHGIKAADVPQLAARYDWALAGSGAD